MKKTLLMLLAVSLTAITNAQDSTSKKKDVSFTIALVPLVYGDIVNIGAAGGSIVRPKKQHQGGVHLQLGVNIENKLTYALAFGYEVSDNQTIIPVYFNFQKIFTDKKVSPTLHFGGGFYGTYQNKLKTFTSGAQMVFGNGIYINVSKRIGVTIAADYRILYLPVGDDFSMQNQIGGRIAIRYW